MTPEPSPLSERIQELIHLGADGRVTPEERAELERILSESPEARADWEAEKAVLNRLSSAASLPTPDLTQTVLEKVRQQKPKVVGFRPRASRSRWIIVGGLGVAASILIGFVTFNQRTPTSAEAVGTMGAMEYSQWPAVAQSEPIQPQGAFSITVRQSGERYFVQARVDSPGPSPVTIRWDRERLLLLNVHRDQGYVSAQTGFGEVVVSGPHQGMVTFLLARREVVQGDANIVIMRDGQILASTVLP